jgi:outer membrane receptor for ferrienterochelin and colicin
MKLTLTILLLLSFFFLPSAYAQKSSVKGKVTDQATNTPIPFANVFIANISLGAVTDTNGNYVITNVPPGTYNITCSSVGYKNQTVNELQVTSVKPSVVDFILEANLTLNEVTVTSSPFNKTEESPLSLRTIGSAEINRNPGGNRDISKVIQSLPGVGSSVSFRNDIFVRGGAPNENRFYIDGIEVPNINHFATQGSSGGPVGMINVNFIREVDFYSGAFPANRGNALSSVLDFKQINGNEEKYTGTAMLGSSDVGLTLEGFTGKKSNFIVSIRRSYLQLLFKALGLPFLPTYNDMQLKETIKFNNNNTLSFFGLGAIDDFVLNKSVNDGVTDTTILQRNDYFLNNIPVNNQWNYTIGAQYKMFSKHGFSTFVVSRNHLNNKSNKYRNNTDNPDDLILDYNSAEIENKLRIEKTIFKETWKFNYGLGYEHALYTNSTFRKIEFNGSPVTNSFSSKLRLNNYSLFAQAGKKLLNEKLVLSLGIRTDFSDYSASMSNPIEQLSPRISLTYSLTEKLFLNFNTGRYFQRPPYTVLGYRDSLNTLINKTNKITYIECNHIIAGLEYNPTAFSKITVEGFYKKYSKYPFLTKDSISLANLGGDFGVIGNEAATSASNGQSYGIEFFAQQKLSSSFYGILSYTFFRSEFKDKDGKYRSSSWDNRHILNLTAGKKLKKNWEVGAKFRMLGGAPYTPYNLSLSSKKEIWNITNQGIFDWNRLNEERFSLSHRLDIRIDKKWFLKKSSINVYLDIQNLYNFKSEGQAYLNVKKDSQGQPITDPADPSSYQTYLISNEDGNILPSIGVMIEF